MTWPELDLAANVWTLPAARAKNGRQHSVPLSEQAIEILQELKSANFAVFEPVSFSREKAQLDAMGQNCPAWTLHDLRRTAASGMAGRGTAPHVIEAVLNHRSGVIKGIASVYNQYSYQAEKKAALDLRRDKIATLTNDSASIANAAYGSQI